MEKPEMSRLVARAKTDNVQLEAERNRLKAEKRQRQIDELVEAERLRVEGLREIIPRWLETMAAADYPGIQPMTIRRTKEVVIEGLFSSRIGYEHEDEEVAGWNIGHHNGPQVSGYEDVPGETVWAIHLLADGRLVSGGGEYKRTGFEVGRSFELGESNTGLWVRSTDVYRAEESIPRNLGNIAKIYGVDWNPDEVTTEAEAA